MSAGLGAWLLAVAQNNTASQEEAPAASVNVNAESKKTYSSSYRSADREEMAKKRAKYVATNRAFRLASLGG